MAIRKFEERDIKNKIRWINDNRNNQYLHYNLPLEYDKTLAWFKRIRHRIDRYDAIIEANGKPVGIIGLINIDNNNGKAEYYITIGEDEYKGKGIATKASKLLLDYAFIKLNLIKVYLFTEIGNIEAQKLFERLGFKKEGNLKNDIKRGDQYINRYVYGMCKDEFIGKIETYNSTIPVLKSLVEDNLTIVGMSPLHKSALEIEGNTLFYKREDLLPFSFGGNKVRKAILFFKDIEKSGSDCVVTYGSSSSNHCRIVANIAISKGLPCYIISPAEDSVSTNNRTITKLLKAYYIMSPLSEVNTTIDEVLQGLRAEGMKPYFIPGGGHGNFGVQAYVDCYHEIINQEKWINMHFDYIFCASGTGATQAGLMCGKIIAGDHRSIVGISIARRNPKGRQVLISSIREYMKHVSKEFDDAQESIFFIDDYVVDGYGSYNVKVLEVISKVLIKDGISLDTTYTGKAFWGMIEYLRKHDITNKKILFIHTGGTPLFFDDLGRFSDG